MRLDAFLAAALNESRSNVKKYIKQKRVSLSGKTVLSSSENTDGKEVFFDGRRLEAKKNIYLLMNKPRGYISTTDNIPESVLSLVPDKFRTKNLAPAGRLDKDSEGLLILTDDGDFAHNIISPSKHMEKVYLITAARPFREEDKKAFESGIVLNDGTVCRPAKLEISDNKTEASVIISEGKYHQVRRMTAAVGNHVERLIRIKIGPYSVEGIKEGQVAEFFPKKNTEG